MRRLNRPSDQTQSVGQSAFGLTGSESAGPGLDYFAGHCPTPEMVNMTMEEFKSRLNALNDQMLVQIAVDKMNGKTNVEIAEDRGIGLRSVERKLALIRKIWSNNSADE